MPPMEKLNGIDAKEILLMEQRGELPDFAQRQLDDLRAEGLVPPALPKGLLPAPPPMSMRQQFDAAASGAGQFAKETARTGALPMAGGLAGAAVGAPFGPPGVLVGESLGSMGGEGLNQLLGITEPSATQIGLAGAGGPVFRAGQRAYRGLRPAIARATPGAAPALHEIAQETLEAIPSRVGPGAMISDALWQRVDTLAPGAKVVTTHLDRATQELQKIYGKSALFDPKAAESKTLQKILAMNNRYQNDVPFDVLDATRKDIGHLTRSTDDRTRKIGERLYRAIEDDYDAFQSMPGRPRALVTTLREARRATLDDLLAERVGKIVGTPGYSSTTLGPNVSVARVTKQLRQDPFLVKHMTPAQIDLIETALQKVKGLPAQPPPKGVKYGSGPNVLAFAAGAGPGALTGDPAVALGLGAATTSIPWMISKIASSEFGQRRLRAMIEGTGRQLDPKAVTALYNAVIAQRPGG